jgi:penicillin-binding protein 1A
MMVYYTIAFPNPMSMRGKETAPVIRIVARDGALLAKRGAAHDYIPITMVPKHVLDAVVATEDRRFFGHWGAIPPDWCARPLPTCVRAGSCRADRH